jgi:4-amino-4-deoxychorismate lyase
MALVNGVPGASVAVNDRGLHYGDGVFETITCADGQPRWLERHLRRLAMGCVRLQIAPPDPQVLRAEITGQAEGTTRCIVKVIVTRGVGSRRGYRPAGDEQTTRVLMRYDWPQDEPAQWRVNLSAVRLGTSPMLAGIKHLNRLEQVLAQQAAAAEGLHEVLLRDGAGHVVSGSMANLFVPLASELLTPAIVDCGVAGVMRSLVIESAPQLGLRVREVALTSDFLTTVPAMFLTNVRLGLQPVHWYAGRRLDGDARVTQLQELIDATVR